MDGISAKAHVVKAEAQPATRDDQNSLEATVPARWASQLLKDLMRLHGGGAAAVSTEGQEGAA